MANHILSNPTSYGNRMQDPRVTALTVISEPHSMCHRGWMYHVDNKITALANGASHDILFVVPAGTFPHMNSMSVSVGRGDVDVLLYEGTTASANGTALTSLNTNRASSNTPSLEIFHTPTITGIGTELHNLWIPPTASGTGNTKAGISDATEGEEWIFSDNQNYLRRITNNSGSIIDVWYEITFYEVGDS